jgi:hypothetical protein
MDLVEKIKKVEALLKGTTSEGERQAAEFALQRLSAKQALDPREYTVSHASYWQRKLFLAICLKYNIFPYRISRQRNTTSRVRVSEAFMNQVLWPEFTKFSDILEKLTSDIVEDLVNEVYRTDGAKPVVAKSPAMAEAVP